jgi:hypothetical protein
VCIWYLACTHINRILHIVVRSFWMKIEFTSFWLVWGKKSPSNFLVEPLWILLRAFSFKRKMIFWHNFLMQYIHIDSFVIFFLFIFSFFFGFFLLCMYCVTKIVLKYHLFFSNLLWRLLVDLIFLPKPLCLYLLSNPSFISFHFFSSMFLICDYKLIILGSAKRNSLITF